MKTNLFHFAKAIVLAGAVTMTSVSCNSDDRGGSNPIAPIVNPNEITFNVGYGIGYTGTAQGNILPLSNADITNTNYSIDFTKTGFKLEDSRTHRLYSTNNGSDVYFLSYLQNQIQHYKVGGTDFYQKPPQILDAKAALGGSNGRWKVIDENTGLIYGVVATNENDESGNFKKRVSTLRISTVDLKSFVLGAPKTIVLPEENNPNLPNQHIWRIDQPVVLNGKVYIGVAKQGYDPTKTGNAANLDGEDIYGSSTLVLDYPTFENPKLIESKLGTGESYGYRTPSYFTYNNSIYHVNMKKSRIFKITNGTYDNSYDFDLKKALGVNYEVGGTGIFYVNNGIAYMPFFDASKGSGTAAKAWGIARVDLNNKTAIKMNVPEGLWLRYYQSAKVVGNKLYMALNPLGEGGNIYIFDATQANPNGFTKGAKLGVTGQGFYIGVF